MYLLKTTLLKKEGTGSVNYWRQISLFITQDTEEYVIRTYYGRSMKTLKLEKEHRYAQEMFANRDFEIIKDQRERYDGYDVIELLSIDACGLPFSDFQPPMFDLPAGDELKDKLSFAQRYVALPIYKGQRIYIKIGCESIVSVRAMNTNNEEFDLPQNLKNSLIKCINPGVFESTILEGYFDGQTLTLTDMACANGLKLTRSYQDRHALLKATFTTNELLSITSFSMANKVLGDGHSEFSNSSARYYLVKDSQTGFKLGDEDNRPFVVPNYYSAFAFVTGPYRNKPDQYVIGMVKDKNFIIVGIVHSEIPLMTSSSIKVNFSGVEAGNELQSPWVAPENTAYSYDELCHLNQLDDLPARWGGLKYI